VSPAPLLIAELERIARDRHWSVADLAARLEVSPKTLYNLRLGHTTLSLDLLSRIIVEFRAYPAIRELAIHFLGDEYPALGRPGHGRKTPGGGPAALPHAVPYRDRWRISAWATRVTRTGGVGKGLFIHGRDTAHLRAATRFLMQTFERSSTPTVLLAANAHLTSSQAKAALAAPALLIERVDHVGADVARLLGERGDRLLATVVTSCVGREEIGDPHLVRLFRASMQVITLDGPAPATPTPQQASLPTSSPPQP